MDRRYVASLSQTQGRVGWSIIFRHPGRRDEAGQLGVRVRRGLGTRDQAEAVRLKADLNELLADSRFWDPSARPEAERQFDSRIVEIFYDKMTPEPADYDALRDELLALPSSADDDYRRALLLGTTGAGKTTLVRQLLGTDPDSERFPSTSTAKTTIHDTEIIVTEGPTYSAVVTFVPSDELRAYVSECATTAVLAAYRGSPDSEVLRLLLNHVNQRFRFSYVLGNGPFVQTDDDDDENGDETPSDRSEPVEDVIDLDATNALLRDVVAEVKRVAANHGEKLRAELAASAEPDQRVIDELFEEELDTLLRDDEEFHAINDRLIDEIERRFDLLDEEDIRKTKQGWPLLWHFETTDRGAFIDAVTTFSSNYAPLFGRLLTPLVNGVRVAGPFFPSWGKGSKLVLLDGEGLGHTPKSSAAISTTLSRRIDEVDAVLLVDNAIQPMQAASVAAMREVISSGNASKLILVFTHFDEVRGDNLGSSITAKTHHVLASAENVLASIGEDLGPYAERALRRRLETSRFLLGGIDEVLDPTTKAARRTIEQLRALLTAIENIIERPPLTPARPVFDRMNLVLAVKAATENFHDAWWPLLGLASKAGVTKEHWTRIKALSRRLASPTWSDEYDNLKPVADLRTELQNHIFVMIQNPIEWTGGITPTDDEKQHFYELFATNIKKRMIDLVTRRMKVERISEWQDAYYQSGRGSTFVRAGIIADQIYDRAAPVPDVTPSPDRNQFLRDVADEVQAAADEVGAVLR